MAFEELLQEVNAIPGVEGAFLLHEEGAVQGNTLPERYPVEALASAARMIARTFSALEASRRKVSEVELFFAGGRLLLRRIPGGILGVCCARSINRPLLDLALQPVIRSLGAALKEQPAAPRKSRAPRAGALRLSTLIQDLVNEGLRLVEAARARGIPMRLLGSVGIAYHSPSAARYLPMPAYPGLELAAPSRHGKALAAFMEEQGYEPLARFNAFYGTRRLHFRKPEAGWPVDVFLDAYEMYHRVEFAAALSREEIALPPDWLLLSRLQAVEAGEAELLEIAVLLLDHEVVEGEQPETVDLRVITGLCAEDWGWYRTVTMNLERAARQVEEWEEPARGRVRERLERLRRAIEAAPKSLGWQMRARLGDAVRWYQTPIRPEEGPRPDMAIG
ncbi:hypothetical protein HRbin22_00769 [Candidatus Thermoflexus japonica]|uniref:Roadblock/LAMTOR2 domain-containing protein n=1 Tax=Candidatus Thermoflexus japonica TaxID=2035417 RepID=A0A2H5Y501_9CHLR|nr:hypothetical protein HRbin22_00769 [Candidatus Thermoflexus japonica]